MADSMAGLGPPGALKRPRFEPGGYLGAADLTVEQDWRRQRFRRHNRHLHGWGIVCGLRVVPALDANRPWGLLVCPGYAMGPYGDEMIVECAAKLDVREWIWSRLDDSVQIAFVAIRYAERTGGPQAIAGAGCGCDRPRMRDTMIEERYRLDVLWAAPEAAAVPPVDLCHDVPPCQPCPPGPYVLLAAVHLPVDEGTVVAVADIDLSVRRVL